MMNQKIISLLSEIALLLPVILIVFTFTGFIQALAAKLMGDKTAERQGFLSLNPLVHIDLLGLTIILIGYFFIGLLFSDPIPAGMFFIMLISFGAQMITPIPLEEKNFKNIRLGGIVVSLSGSIGNFILAIITTLCIKGLPISKLPIYIFVSLMGILSETRDLSILFGLLSLIPLPPFAGGKVLRYILPPTRRNIVTWLEERSFFILLILFFLPGVREVFLGTLGFAKKLLLSLIK